MAPASSLQPIDMSLTQKVDIQQSYWLLFDKMKDDFVHKEDLKIILQTALVNGGSVAQAPTGVSPVVAAIINATMTDAIAQAKAVVYAKLAQTGAAVREKGIEAAEKATTGV